MKVESWPIDRVKPYPRNPRKNDAAVPKVAASIREFGFRQPIVVDEEGVVIVGHTRLKAAQSLGLTEVPVHVAKGLTPSQVKAYRLADNRTNEEAEWDGASLGLELSDLELEEYDLQLTGFSDDEIQQLLGRIDDGAAEARLGGVEYQIIVSCSGEAEQAALCERLESEGYKCRLLTL